MPLSFADLTGISALCLSIYTAYLQRRHNYQSLSPIAQIRFYDYEDCIAVRIANAGLGPMTITSFIASDEGNSSKSNLIDWMPPHPDGIVWDTYFEEMKGVTILPNDEAAVIRLKQNNIEATGFSEFRDAVRHALSHLHVEIEYQDVYKRNMPTCSRSLKWFGREKPKQRRHN